MSERGRRYLELRATEGTVAAYDYLASEFEKDTGKMAPGKDVPAAMGGGDFTATMEEFHQWRKQHGLYPIITHHKRS